jgi:hypothetical protein
MLFRRKTTSQGEPLEGHSDHVEGLDKVERALFSATRHEPKQEEIDRSQLEGGLGWAAAVEKNGWAIDHFQEFPSSLEAFTDARRSNFFCRPLGYGKARRSF